MTIRSVIDVEMNQEQFDRFNVLWQKYHGELQKQPGLWAGVNKDMKSGFQAVAAALLAMQQTQRTINKDQQVREKHVREESSLWRDIAKSTKAVATNIKDSTISLLKWAGITGIISGLIGGGGLFGLDLLAANVGTTRRSALGLGVSYGEQQAFGLNFGRVVDSDSFLSAVNAATHDVTKRYALYGAGLSEGDLKGNTAQVSLALIQRLKSLADRTPQPLLAQTMQARGLDQFLSLEDFERLKNTPASELSEYARAFNRDKNSLGLSPRNQLQWQNFQVQLSRAGAKIENVFVEGLGRAKIPEALAKLSDAVAQSIKTFIDSGNMKAILDELGRGILWLGRKIGSPSFQRDMDEFIKDVGEVAKGLYHALQWLGLIPQSKEEKENSMRAAAKAQGESFASKFLGWGSGAGKWLNGTMTDAADWAARQFEGNSDTEIKTGEKSQSQSQWTGKNTFESPEQAQMRMWLQKMFPNAKITSEGRTAAYNATLEGSAKNSMHISGEALDIQGVSYEMLAAAIKAAGLRATELFNEGRHGNQGPHIHWGWRQKDGRHGSAPQKVEISVNNNTGGNVVMSSAQLAGGYGNFAGNLVN